MSYISLRKYNDRPDRHLAPIVPPELGDYIVDFLHNDPRTLKACSLTCRNWLPTARYHLFRSITIHDSRLCTAFSRLLQSSPVLGYYVQHLDVAKISLDASSAVTASDAIGEISSLASIFPYLGGLKSLALSRLALDAATGERIRQASCGTVTELSIQYCQFPTFGDFLDLAESFPRLESLALLGVTWQDNVCDRELQPQPRPRRPSRLRKLSLGKDVDIARIMEWLLAESLHEEIDTLSVCCTSEKHVIIAGYFIRALGPSLKHFDVDWSLHASSKPSIPDDLRLDLCAELQSLTLRFPIYFNSSVPWVTTLLSSLTSSSISKLTMEMRLLGGLDALDWKESGRILSQSRFNKLDMVSFKVLVLPGIYMGVEEVKDLIINRLPDFNDKGMIRFL